MLPPLHERSPPSSASTTAAGPSSIAGAGSGCELTKRRARPCAPRVARSSRPVQTRAAGRFRGCPRQGTSTGLESPQGAVMSRTRRSNHPQTAHGRQMTARQGARRQNPRRAGAHAAAPARAVAAKQCLDDRCGTVFDRRGWQWLRTHQAAHASVRAAGGAQFTARPNPHCRAFQGVPQGTSTGLESPQRAVMNRTRRSNHPQTAHGWQIAACQGAKRQDPSRGATHAAAPARAASNSTGDW